MKKMANFQGQTIHLSTYAIHGNECDVMREIATQLQGYLRS